MEQLPQTITAKKVNGELVLQGTSALRHKMFFDSLEEGSIVEITYEPVHGDISYGQLSKIHKCIRIIADETGETFEEVKKRIKEKSGLFSKIEHLKSFGGISKAEASKVIEEIQVEADFLNINIHNF
jgi:hypothetical protein